MARVVDMGRVARTSINGQLCVSRRAEQFGDFEDLPKFGRRTTDRGVVFTTGTDEQLTGD